MLSVSGTSTSIIPPFVWDDSFYEKANVSRTKGLTRDYPFSGTSGIIMNPSNWATAQDERDLNSIEIEITKDISDELIERYKKIVIQSAQISQLEDGTWYAELPSFPGVWATDENSRENALTELGEVLEEWIVIKIQMNDGDIPIVDGIDLN